MAFAFTGYERDRSRLPVMLTDERAWLQALCNDPHFVEPTLIFIKQEVRLSFYDARVGW